jgi:hypothetical protein
MIFTILYILIGLGMILSFINTVYEHYSKTKRLLHDGQNYDKEDA